jgi:hypothetical protein
MELMRFENCVLHLQTSEQQNFLRLFLMSTTCVCTYGSAGTTAETT